LRSPGFTLVELVATLAIVAILALVIAPRFAERRVFDTRGFFDQCQAVVRHAQKVAIAQRRMVFIDITAGRIGACFDAPCTQRVPPPLGYLQSTTPAGASNPTAANCANDANWLCAGAPSDVTLATLIPSFSFNGLGRPSLGAALLVSVQGEPVRTFTIEHETGYVH